METIGVPSSPSLRVLARLSGRRPWSCDWNKATAEQRRGNFTFSRF
jgi:hypothetical protein